MPAAPAEAAPETLTIPADGGFMERLGSTLNADPAAAAKTGGDPNRAKPTEQPQAAPEAKSATPTLETPQDAPESKGVAKKDPPEAKVESKTSALDNLKKLASGDKKEEKPAAPPTPEQKKEYTMKELRVRADQAEALEKKIAEMEANYSKYKDVDIDAMKKSLEEKEKAVEDYKKKLAALDIMQSDQYVENVSKPMESIWADLKKASDEFKFPLNELGAALNIQDHRQRLAALSKVFDSAEGDMDPLNRQELVNASLEFLRREYYGRQLLADADKVKESFKAEQARKEKEEKEMRSKTFQEQSEDIFKQMFAPDQLEDMPFLVDKDEDGKIKPKKELLDQIRQSAKDDSDQPWRHALKSYSLELLPVVMEYAKNQDAKVKELEDRIAKMSGLGPSANGSLKPEDMGGDPDANLSLQERIQRQQKAQGLAFNPS